MKDKKIAFVVFRYGIDINGGAEYHCRMLAERLADGYNVEVLTTCIRYLTTCANEFYPGIEELNGVTVRRFFALAEAGCNASDFNNKKIKIARKLRRRLYRMGVLKFFPIKYKKYRQLELELFGNLKANSPELLNFLSEHKDDYHKIIFLTYMTPSTILGINICKEKSILIPTAHNEGMLFYPVMTDVFSFPAHIAFNTVSEQKLCSNIFNDMAANSIVGVKFNEAEPANFDTVKQKYNIPDNYILYVGRVEPGKTGKLVEYFLKFKNENSTVKHKLVMTGGIGMSVVNNPNIIYTGYVTEEEKFCLIKNSAVVVNPSLWESLSLIVLEALSMEIPVLVNGGCDVLKEHIKKSNAGFFYENYKQFHNSLFKLLDSETLRNQMGALGKKYVDNNYEWDIIIGKLRNIIES
ncbi:MAG: glycosyltransferase family 4 protein [Cytophagaceae bacterium]|jgi:glycosyltransferase involved in cell wall biosynthesis|nr:glycosyltransferase family 4 protein [Cytophagaceae bacterium]